MTKKTTLAFSTLLLTMTGTAAMAAEITVMGYRGVFEEAYVKTVVEPFRAANPDITVHYFGTQNSAATLGNIRAQRTAPSVNAVIFDLSVAKIGAEEGLLAYVPLDKIAAYDDLFEIGKELGGKAFPLTYDNFNILYNSQALAEAPASWNEFWNPEHDGMLVFNVQGGSDIQAILLTIMANRLAGEEDYADTIQPGLDKLVELAPMVQTWEPKPDAYTAVAEGTAHLSVGYNARSQYYVDVTDGRVRPAVPAEGTAMLTNVISMVEGASEEEATLRFINYALSPEAQAALAAEMYYAPTNLKTELAPEVSARIPFMDPELRAMLVNVDWLKISEIRDNFSNGWRRQVIPASR